MAHRWLDRVAGWGGAESVFARVLRFVAAFLLWLVGAFLLLARFCDPAGQNLNAWWRPFLETIHANRFFVVSVLILLQVVCRSLLWLVKRWNPFNVTKLQKVLDSIVMVHFEEQERANHFYRATLFKVRHCWGVGSWLGIVARSGALYPQRTAVFSIDARMLKNNTGIVGECWRRGGQTIIIDLPNVRDSESPTEVEVSLYKTAGCLDDREYAATNVKSRVFLATGIRVAGELWGVLVLDTTDLSKLPKENQHKRHRAILELSATSLQQLVS